MDEILGDEVTHPSEERPWGSWHVLDEGEGYKVKRIEVQPHKRLSYQTHAHRAEIWVVVQGTATCLIDGRTSRGADGRDRRGAASGQPTGSATTTTRTS